MDLRSFLLCLQSVWTYMQICCYLVQYLLCRAVFDLNSLVPTTWICAVWRRYVLLIFKSLWSCSVQLLNLLNSFWHMPWSKISSIVFIICHASRAQNLHLIQQTTNWKGRKATVHCRGFSWNTVWMLCGNFFEWKITIWFVDVKYFQHWDNVPYCFQKSLFVMGCINVGGASCEL